MIVFWMSQSAAPRVGACGTAGAPHTSFINSNAGCCLYAAGRLVFRLYDVGSRVCAGPRTPYTQHEPRGFGASLALCAVVAHLCVFARMCGYTRSRLLSTRRHEGEIMCVWRRMSLGRRKTFGRCARANAVWGERQASRSITRCWMPTLLLHSHTQHSHTTPTHNTHIHTHTHTHTTTTTTPHHHILITHVHVGRPVPPHHQGIHVPGWRF